METMDQEEIENNSEAMDLEEENRDVTVVSNLNLAASDGEELSSPLFENGRFYNSWGACSRQKMADSFKQFFLPSNARKVPNKSELDRTLPVIRPNLMEFNSSPVSGIRHLWIGHSTSLLQMDGFTILTDPMFSERCSPSQLLGGHRRFRPTPCSISELPHIDFVLISHTHYDHLDYGSVLALNQRYGGRLRWYVPKGLTKWMRECGCVNVVEMTWWEETVHSHNSDIKVVCTPCQHSGKRTPSGENKVLWCSWCVIGPRHSFYFAGDTAYCKGFKQIGQRYGPFTLSTIPIGSYSPRSAMANFNVDPEHAVNIHLDIKSQASIGIHWGTFSMSDEHYLEPKQLLEQEIIKRGMKPSSFFTVSHGEISLVGSDYYDDLD